MSKKLRKHQRAALRYALRVPYPALFLQMRLGKTLVAIRRCKLLKPMRSEVGLRVLVVAPSSALGSWERECKDEGENVVWLTGKRKERREQLTLLWGGYHLINKEGWIALPEIASYPWDAVILDESTFVKNPQAKVTKFFCRNFRRVPMRMILTGTPDPESPADYYCQFQFLYGRAFGCSNYWDFREQYMCPSSWGYGWEMKAGASDTIRREVGRRSCVMQRSDVGYDEQRVYERRELELPASMRKAYNELESTFALDQDDVSISTIWKGGQYSWLRQMCGGFIDGNAVWSGKADIVTDLLTGELAREQAVIWCDFNNEVSLVCDSLLRKHVLCAPITGRTPEEERRRLVREFQDGNIRVLALQQRIAQTGMDLSAADTAIYYSTPLGGFARSQTEDRILSLEKIEAGVPMLFIDLVCKSTVDEDAMTLLDDKKLRSKTSMQRALQRALKERIQWTQKL